MSYLAANKIGGVAVPLPGKFQRPEILSLLEKADVTTIICEEKFGPWFENLEQSNCCCIEKWTGFWIGLDAP